MPTNTKRTVPAKPARGERRAVSRSAARTLSAEQVVQTGLALADRDGMSAVTLGAVAREIGCHVTSLYTHVDSIDDLHVRMALDVQQDLGQRLWQAALGRTGEEALRALADVYRSFGGAQPARTWLLFTMTGKADDRFRAGAQHLVEPIRATLRSFGLEDDQVLHAHRAFSGAMRGFILAEAQGAYGDDADATFTHVVDLFVGALADGGWPRKPEAFPATRVARKASGRGNPPVAVGRVTS